MENSFDGRDKAVTRHIPGASNPEKKTGLQPSASFRNEAIAGNRIAVDGASYERGADGAFHRIGETSNAPVAEHPRTRTASVIPDKNGLIALRPGEYVNAAFRDDASPHKHLVLGDIWYACGENGVFRAFRRTGEAVAQPPLDKEAFTKTFENVLSTHIDEDRSAIQSRQEFDRAFQSILSTHEASPAFRLKRFVGKQLSRFFSPVARRRKPPTDQPTPVK